MRALFKQTESEVLDLSSEKTRKVKGNVTRNFN